MVSPPIASHIAARAAGVEIGLDLVRERADALAAQADCLIVKGVGGWWVPLGPDLAVSDLPRALDLPVILVVGLRLGGIYHALLTAESILASGCHWWAGWPTRSIRAWRGGRKILRPSHP